MATTNGDPWYVNWPHLVNYIEIPTADFDRAVAFYSALYDAELPVSEQPTAMGDPMKRAFLPRKEGGVGGALIKFHAMQPARGGVLVYLHGGEDLQVMLDRVEPAGGQVVVPKSIVDDTIGYFAIFVDSEGNEIALHSPR